MKHVHGAGCQCGCTAPVLIAPPIDNGGPSVDVGASCGASPYIVGDGPDRCELPPEHSGDHVSDGLTWARHTPPARTLDLEDEVGDLRVAIELKADAIAQLTAERDAARGLAQQLWDQLAEVERLHRPWGMWDECSCTDKADGDGKHTRINELGLTCVKLYDVCRHCCTEGGEGEFNTEDCVAYHDHTNGHLCLTRDVLPTNAALLAADGA